jgi:hypothetical protein
MLLSTTISFLNNSHKIILPFTKTNPLESLPTRRSFSTHPPVVTSQTLKSKDYEAYIADCLQKLSTLPDAEPFEVFRPYYPKLKNGKPDKRISVDVAVKFKNVPTYLGDPN